MADNVSGENSLKMRAIYSILKLVKAGKKTDDKRRLIRKKTTRRADMIAAIATAVKKIAEFVCSPLLKPLTSLLGLSSTSFTTILTWLRRVQDGS